MDFLDKLSLLGGYSAFDVDSSQDKTPANFAAIPSREPAMVAPAAQVQCGDFVDANPSTPRKTDVLSDSISILVRSDGKRVPVLKTMLSSYCARNCFYCPWRRGRDLPRVQFTPEEMSSAFMQMHQKRLVDGLFLSSGIHGRAAWTMERLVAVGDILRTKYQYKGYIHLKVMPGVDRASVEAVMRVADRVSINLEAPNPERLRRLAPEKNMFEQLLPPLYWADEINRERRAKGMRPVSTVTQFVGGATGESDRDIMTTTSQLLREAHLTRPYFSAFHPVRDTPLEGLPAEDQLRQHRLYQADFLLRQYQFAYDDLVFDSEGNFDRKSDPKRSYAVRLPVKYRHELTLARREELLRVPGIGPRSADRIIALRREGALIDFRALEQVGFVTRRAAPFILLKGRRPTRQLSLF
jgi:predicted DNA-binding helix-hairpin-helix protein